MTVTLVDLRAQFEAAYSEAVRVSVRLGTHRTKYISDRMEDHACAAGKEPYGHCSRRMAIAARRYIIARDFNVFDPKEADMLWRLQKL